MMAPEERDLLVLRHLESQANPAGLIPPRMPGRVASAIGITFDQLSRALARLEHAGILVVEVAGSSARPPVWSLTTTGLEADARLDALATPDHGGRTDLDDDALRRVSLRLLARLLKFHSANPPDAEAAAAAARWRDEFRREAFVCAS